MSPYRPKLIDITDLTETNITKIRRAAASKLKRRKLPPPETRLQRPSPNDRNKDLAELPWFLPGGKMDRVKQRHIDGGLALFDWTATAERELQEEIGPGGTEGGGPVCQDPLRVVRPDPRGRCHDAVNGDAAHAKGTVFRPNKEDKEYRAGEWVPLADVYARCAKGGDLSVM